MSMQSTELAWREIRILYNELQDPFVIFPMQSAIFSLSEALSQVELSFVEQMGLCGVARKFWDVQTEILHEEKGIIIGNAFVLAQVVVAQTVVIFIRIRRHCKNCTLPGKKETVLQFESEIALHGSLSEVMVIESVANYFKHQHEWPEDWEEKAATPLQAKTLRSVKDIGMTPGDLTENMEIALRDLRIRNDLPSILHKVQSWRERLANRLSFEPEIVNSVLKYNFV